MNKKVFLLLLIAFATICKSNAQSYMRFRVDTASIVESTDSVLIIVEQKNDNSSVDFVGNVAYDAAASTAIIDTDFNFSNRAFQLAPGESRNDTIKIRLKQDNRYEGTEYVVLKLHSILRPYDIPADSVFTLTLFDDDDFIVSFIGAGKSYIENDTVAVVRVATNGIAPDSVVVKVSLDLGNATKNVDYSFKDTTIVFRKGTDDTLGVKVTLYSDTVDEINEQLNLNLIKISGSAIPVITAFTLTIIDDDSTISSIMDNSFIAAAVSIYPNPFSSGLSIATDLQFDQMILFNAQGQVCLQQNFDRNLLPEKIQALPKGNYILQLMSSDKLVRKNLIKVN
jgi:hypothetical protein